MMADWEDRIPASTLRDIQDFAEKGVPPGSFVRAVLENDLKEACAMADDWNRRVIFEVVGFCYNRIPSASWGSPDKVREWIESFRTVPAGDATT